MNLTNLGCWPPGQISRVGRARTHRPLQAPFGDKWSGCQARCYCKVLIFHQPSKCFAM